MASTQLISSTDNPKVKAAAKLQQGRHRRATGLFVVESLRDLDRAIAAGLAVQQLFYCPTLLGDQVAAIYVDRASAGENYEVTESVVRKLAYRENPAGIVAVIEQPQWTFDSISWRDDSLLLVAQGLTKPGNLGAIARTAAAAGCAAVIVADAVIDPFNPNAIRASTGAVFALPIICADSDACRTMLRQHSVDSFAAALSSNSVTHTRADYANRCAIIIGTEDQGLTDDWLDFCSDQGNEHASEQGAIISIPMATSAIDSLNASVAAGVLLFEVIRQRNQNT